MVLQQQVVSMPKRNTRPSEVLKEDVLWQAPPKRNKLNPEQKEQEKQRNFVKIDHLIRRHIQQGKEPDMLRDICRQLLKSGQYEPSDLFCDRGWGLLNHFMSKQLVAGLDFVVSFFPAEAVDGVWRQSGAGLVALYFERQYLEYESFEPEKKAVILHVLHWLCKHLDETIVSDVARKKEPQLKERFPRCGAAIFKDYYTLVLADSAQQPQNGTP